LTGIAPAIASARFMSADARWQPRLDQEARLRQLEALLATEKDAIDARAERAALLAALDRREEAKAAFLSVLERDPTHFAALTDFGALLVATGFVSAARTVYAQAVAHHPANAKARVNLANLLYANGDLIYAREHYEAALALDPEQAHAHQGLGRVFAELGEPERADWHRQRGYRDHALTALPYRGQEPPLPILVLTSAIGGNIPTTSLLDDRIFLSTVVTADFFDTADALPPHRLIFNTIGDADLCKAALQAAIRLVRGSLAPIINMPEAVLATGRVNNAKRLAEIDGVIAPNIVSMPRTALNCRDATAVLAQCGLAFPLLARSPGFHTGRHFAFIGSASELAPAIADLPGDELLLISYLDARGADGNARKYRVMVVERKLYPLHLAISRDWKVHYYTAGMEEHAAHRDEEATFLADMPGTLGAKAMTALERIAEELNLDYAGIDFGLGAAGDVLLFEANATMVVNPQGPDERFAYRRPAITAILDAFRAFILCKAGVELGRIASRDN
jgi:hypothetical protein